MLMSRANGCLRREAGIVGCLDRRHELGLEVSDAAQPFGENPSSSRNLVNGNNLPKDEKAHLSGY